MSQKYEYVGLNPRWKENILSCETSFQMYFCNYLAVEFEHETSELVPCIDIPFKQALEPCLGNLKA